MGAVVRVSRRRTGNDGKVLFVLKAYLIHKSLRNARRRSSDMNGLQSWQGQQISVSG